MIFFKPNPILIRRIVIGENPRYFLKTTTYCDQFNYSIDPNVTMSNDVDENGNFEVNLNLFQDDTLPSNPCTLPLVHFVELGALSNSEVLITINLTVENNQDSISGKKKKGATTVSTVLAEEESRPIEQGEWN